MAATPNRLANATSPYLLQHADNPVDWYPWGEEALDKARREGKPILLSIGYSACHWCHVMAHESFEDEATAALMNRLFVNIKVDREQRPDLDKIYQTTHQLLTQRSGGWPLTVFLNAEQIPIFAGTYFPPEPRHGLPAFGDVLRRVVAYIEQHPQEITDHNRSLLEALAQLSRAPPPGALSDQPLERARRQLQEDFDGHHGGFGEAPKFPHPTSIERLLRHYGSSMAQGRPDRQALHMACLTLRRMALGGIFDQVGGGFSRYSVDRQWMIPHFEKMLCDNGQLIGLYADAWHATGDELYARIAGECAEWIVREMQSPEGGYYSSVDADSEGEEGRYYVWSREQLRELLDRDDYQLVERRFGIDEAPNFEGRWHLHVHASFSELAHNLKRERGELLRRWQAIRAQLYAARERRVRPGRDDKILTGWNALAIKGMARAGRLLQAPELVRSARRALAFIRGNLWQNGRLLASYKDGRAQLGAYLDDHAFLLDAVLELLQSDWQDADLELARQLAELLLTHFEDGEHGSFYFTADDHEALIQRPRPLLDEATPAGNGVAAFALNRLGHLLAEPRYIEAARRTLEVAARPMQELPYAHCSLLHALEEHLQPPQRIIVRVAHNEATAWIQAAERYYAPRRMAFYIPPQAKLPQALAAMNAGDTAAGYVCDARGCSTPLDSPERLAEHLLGG